MDELNAASDNHSYRLDRIDNAEAIDGNHRIPRAKYNHQLGKQLGAEQTSSTEY